MKWAAEHDDLSLIPYLSDTEKNVLRAGGIATTRELATLKAFPDDSAQDLVTPPERRASVQALSASRAVGPRLDELVHRARRYRRWRGDDLRALSYIPSKGYGSLPAVEAGLHPNLVRIYLDVQHDYLHDRVYLLGRPGGRLRRRPGGPGAPAQHRAHERRPARRPGRRARPAGGLGGRDGARHRGAGRPRRRGPAPRAHPPDLRRPVRPGLLLDALARHFGGAILGPPRSTTSSPRSPASTRRWRRCSTPSGAS